MRVLGVTTTAWGVTILTRQLPRAPGYGDADQHGMKVIGKTQIFAQSVNLPIRLGPRVVLLCYYKFATAPSLNQLNALKPQ